MKKKNKYAEKVKVQNHNANLSKDMKWIGQVTLMAFILSLALSFVSDTVIPNVATIASIVVLILFIALGIVFDMVGVSVTVSDPKVFNSMASKKIKGAKTALLMIKNNSKVSSFCNDVVGDICGIISGGAGITIGTSIASMSGTNSVIINLIITSLIASITIGGKALGKSHAINRANSILYKFAKIIEIVTFK